MERDAVSKDGRASLAQEEEDVVLVEQAGEESAHDDTGEDAGTWHLVRRGMTAAAAAVQRPLHYAIGSDAGSECLGEVFDTHITITLPRWALLSLLGLGGAVLWQQGRRASMAERQHAEIVQLLGVVLESTQSAHRSMAQQATLAQQSVADHAIAAVERSRDAGWLGVALGAGAAFLLLSDKRLKKHLRRLPGHIGSCPLYAWEWSEVAKDQFGLQGNWFGVIAQEVAVLCPKAVRTGSDGYMRVDYMGLCALP